MLDSVPAPPSPGWSPVPPRMAPKTAALSDSLVAIVVVELIIAAFVDRPLNCPLPGALHPGRRVHVAPHWPIASP